MAFDWEAPQAFKQAKLTYTLRIGTNASMKPGYVLDEVTGISRSDYFYTDVAILSKCESRTCYWQVEALEEHPYAPERINVSQPVGVFELGGEIWAQDSPDFGNLFNTQIMQKKDPNVSYIGLTNPTLKGINGTTISTYPAECFPDPPVPEEEVLCYVIAEVDAGVTVVSVEAVAESPTSLMGYEPDKKEGLSNPPPNNPEVFELPVKMVVLPMSVNDGLELHPDHNEAGTEKNDVVPVTVFGNALIQLSEINLSTVRFGKDPKNAGAPAINGVLLADTGPNGTPDGNLDTDMEFLMSGTGLNPTCPAPRVEVQLIGATNQGAWFIAKEDVDVKCDQGCHN